MKKIWMWFQGLSTNKKIGFIIGLIVLLIVLIPLLPFFFVWLVFQSGWLFLLLLASGSIITVGLLFFIIWLGRLPRVLLNFSKQKPRVAIVVIMAVLIAITALNAVYEINRIIYEDSYIRPSGQRVPLYSPSVKRGVQIELTKAMILGTSVLIIGGLFLYILREEKEEDKEK